MNIFYCVAHNATSLNISFDAFFAWCIMLVILMSNDPFLYRTEAARSHLHQQQALTIYCHLHWAASHTAALGEAKQCGKEEHGKALIIKFSFMAKHTCIVNSSSHSKMASFILCLQVTLPVYLNFTRTDLIFTVDFDIATKEDPHSFYERGVAVLCTE